MNGNNCFCMTHFYTNQSASKPVNQTRYMLRIEEECVCVRERESWWLKDRIGHSLVIGSHIGDCRAKCVTRWVLRSAKDPFLVPKIFCEDRTQGTGASIQSEPPVVSINVSMSSWRSSGTSTHHLSTLNIMRTQVWTRNPVSSPEGTNIQF